MTMNQKPIRKVPCEIYSRVVGYLRPIQNWNKGKVQEYGERVPYEVKGERPEDDEPEDAQA